MIIIIEHGKGTAYPSVWLAKSKHSKAEYNANTRPYFAMYHTGELPPNHPMPAIRYTEELIVMNDKVSFCLMYRLPNNFMRPVGDSPQYPLIF